MKHIDYKVITNLIKELPSLHILLIANFDDDECVKTIQKHLRDFDGSMDLYTFKKEFHDVENLLDNVTYKGALKSDICDLKFQHRAYELVLIIGDIVKNIDDCELFFKNIYHSLENSGNLYMVVKNSKELYENIKLNLEKVNFLAVNDIELDENYQIIYSKKMHGWGGGF